MPEIDAKALHILQHALGVDQYGRGKRYRNHFVTGNGTVDFPHCMALVDAGLMTRRPGTAISGWDDVFTVTAAGISAMYEQQIPAPPKLTRSQQRYQEYIDADCGETFGEWLRFRREHA
jgi:hypothetical protein